MTTGNLRENTIDIIGAGIGGLSAALILNRKGCKVTVFESATVIKPLGAGIILASNAMQIYKKYGLHDKLQEAGNRISYMKITDPQLKPLSVVDLTIFEKKYNVSNVAIHRAALQQILIEEVGLENIRLSKHLSIVKKETNYQLEFEDHLKCYSSAIIGADGIHSTVRDQIFNKGVIRNAGQICWRGITKINLAQKYHHELNESWGRGRRFGFVRINSEQVYWYALINNNNGYNTGTNVMELFENFHPDILNIIAATPTEKVIVNTIIDLKLIPTWQNKNVCLLGDAAHAMTPNLGQGACQAIEDAYVLGECLSKYKGIQESFRRYEQSRIKKAQTLVTISWNTGKVAHIENKYGVWLRNNMMKAMPGILNKRLMEMIFKIG